MNEQGKEWKRIWNAVVNSLRNFILLRIIFVGNSLCGFGTDAPDWPVVDPSSSTLVSQNVSLSYEANFDQS